MRHATTTINKHQLVKYEKWKRKSDEKIAQSNGENCTPYANNNNKYIVSEWLSIFMAR